MRYFAGIDPGLTGAVAILDFKEAVLHLYDTPVITVKTASTNRKRCDPYKFADILCGYKLDEAIIEKVHSTPNDGHVGAFSFGKVTGIAIGILAGADIPFREVSPAVWKHKLAVPAQKEAATHRASVLFPLCVNGWKRALDHGRAEATLIALYGSIERGLLPTKPFTLGSINGART